MLVLVILVGRSIKDTFYVTTISFPLALSPKRSGFHKYILNSGYFSAILSSESNLLLFIAYKT